LLALFQSNSILEVLSIIQLNLQQKAKEICLEMSQPTQGKCKFKKTKVLKNLQNVIRCSMKKAFHQNNKYLSNNLDSKMRRKTRIHPCRMRLIYKRI